MATRAYEIPKKPFAAAIFFDNLNHNIESTKNTCPGIVTVRTAGDEYDKLKQRAITGPFMRSFLKRNKLERNPYARLLKFSGGYAMPQAGAFSNPRDLKILNKWLADTKDLSPRAVMFDWDGTLTLFEDDTLPYDKTSVELAKKYMVERNPELAAEAEAIDDITDEDILEYFFGGKQRLARIRKIMQMIRSAGAEIFIVTNGSIFRPDFHRLARLLFKGAGVDAVIMSSRWGSPGKMLPHRGDKGVYFQEQPFLLPLCNGGKESSTPVPEQPYLSSFYDKAKELHQTVSQQPFLFPLCDGATKLSEIVSTIAERSKHARRKTARKCRTRRRRSMKR